MKQDTKKPGVDSAAANSEKFESRRTAIRENAAFLDGPLGIMDILDALPFYVMLVDETHHILQANSAVRDHLGLEPESIVGEYCPEIIHKVNEPWYACPLEEAQEKGQSVEREALDQNSGRWIKSAIYPVERLTRDGRKIFFHMVSDISDRKTAEQRAETAHQALKIYAAHMVNSQEEERKRIARELHDDTIQTLALLCRKLDHLSESQPPSSPLSEELIQAREISEGVAQRIRYIVRSIRPPILEHLGIVFSVRRLLLDLNRRTGIEWNIKLSGEERRLDPDIEISLFRIAQEALWNTERHSKSTKVIVTVDFGKRQVRLDINDNGVGFAVPDSLTELSSRGHLGLLGMQERAELAGGNLEIQSSPDKGTLISLTIPTPENISEVSSKGSFPS